MNSEDTTLAGEENLTKDGESSLIHFNISTSKRIVQEKITLLAVRDEGVLR